MPDGAVQPKTKPMGKKLYRIGDTHISQGIRQRVIEAAKTASRTVNLFKASRRYK